MRKLIAILSFTVISIAGYSQTAEKTVTIPNVFSPNLDGKNDMFLIETTGVRSLKARIFNRWGEIVYTWNSLNGGWDGYTFAGKKCPAGTYYYVVTYVGQDDEISEEKGTVTLLR